MKKLLAVCLICCLLCGCGLHCEYRAQADENTFLVEISFLSNCPVSSVSYRYCLDGKVIGSGGVCNADNSPITQNDVLLIPFNRHDIPENADLSGFELQLFLTNAEGNTFPCKLSAPSGAAFGQVCSLQLDGDFINGFTART